MQLKVHVNNLKCTENDDIVFECVCVRGRRLSQKMSV